LEQNWIPVRPRVRSFRRSQGKREHERGLWGGWRLEHLVDLGDI
jgi:hypothetical protein